MPNYTVRRACSVNLDHVVLPWLVYEGDHLLCACVSEIGAQRIITALRLADREEAEVMRILAVSEGA